VRILAAGGAGFIGGHLVRRLLEQGHDVVVVDNLSTGRPETVQGLRHHPGFSFIEQDVARTPDVPCDAIIHLASPASPVHYSRIPMATMSANAFGAWRLLEIAKGQGARLLFVSTSEIYGDPLVHPQPEEYWGNVDPVGPRACYDESKRFGEALVMAARGELGIQANIVRLFNIYGPGMALDDGRVVPEMIASALRGEAVLIHGDGLQTRSFCYVDDLVDAMVRVLEDAEIDGQILNIGNPEEVTILSLASRIVGMVGAGPIVHVPGRPGDPGRRMPVITRFTGRYGWTPSTALDEGLRATISDLSARLGIAMPRRA